MLAFSERKNLYAVFFAIFFVFAAAGAFAFPLLNAASERQALTVQMQESLRFSGDATLANAFALSRRELVLAAVAFFCGFTVFSPGRGAALCGSKIAVAWLFTGNMRIVCGNADAYLLRGRGTALNCFFALLFAVEVFRYVRISVNGAAEMFKARQLCSVFFNSFAIYYLTYIG